MPRPPAVVQEKFLLHAEVPGDLMGPVLAMLLRMGVTQTGYELASEERTFHRNANAGQPRKTFAVTGREALLALFKDGAELTTKEMQAAFEAEGRTAGSTSSLLAELKAEGLLIQTGRGVYKLADKIKLLPKPRAAAAVEAAEAELATAEGKNAKKAPTKAGAKKMASAK